jgi:hypothetical protein
MMVQEIPYLPEHAGPPVGPLSRYLPPIPEGLAAAWLKKLAPPGSLVVDPFGASPHTLVQIARAGYRVITASNNPILSFMIETLASAPGTEDFQAALADLAATRKGEDRLEIHIQSLYTSECSNCHQPVNVKAFIWQKKSNVPEAALVECAHCGDAGERPVSPASLDRLAGLARGGSLHRSRAIERVAALDDPIRSFVDQALNFYLPRPLYVLMTLINRLEGLSSKPDRIRCLTALLLSACDEGNTLWPFPMTRSRPRQLTQPPVFRENNLWQSLEGAIEQWRSVDTAVTVTDWPELPAEGGGITLYRGRFKDLAKKLPGIPIQAVLAIFPRPNQAFWTLSALWAGWLWGKEAVAPLRNVLPRQRYDWHWYASALEAVLSNLNPNLKPGTPVLGLLSEAEPSFLASVLCAANASELDWVGLASRPGNGLVQISWQASQRSHETPSPVSLDEVSALSIQAHLSARAEPAPYSVLHAAALSALAEQNRLIPSPGELLPAVLIQVQTALQRVFADPKLLAHFNSSQHSPEAGLWWLQSPQPPGMSLADRTEIEVVKYLQRHPGCNLEQIDETVCANLPGLLTPPLDLVQACLESYGLQSPPESNHWQLLSSEVPAERRSELKAMQQLLISLGQRLGYSVNGENPTHWRDETGKINYQFWVMASTIVSRYIFEPQVNPHRAFLVLPGSRANLMTYKLKRDPWLNQAISSGWRFIKFRHLRLLASSLIITREDWEDRVNSDPIEYKPTQIEMF